jgi:hypothetical protein
MAGGIRQDISMQAVNLSNMKHLIEWIKQSNLDPYDPENAFLINLMKVRPSICFFKTQSKTSVEV